MFPVSLQSFPPGISQISGVGVTQGSILDPFLPQLALCSLIHD